MPATNGKSNRSKFFAYLMFGDIFLVGLQPILIQASKVGGKYAYNPLTLNLLIEATKTTVMLSLLLIRGIGKNKYGSPSLQSVKQMLRQNYLLIVPACLYALNNYVKFIMQLYFEPTNVKMISNLKVFCIACLSVVLLKKSYSPFQWEALLLLVLGVAVNQMKGGSGGTSVEGIAWLYTLVSIGMSSLASVFNEKFFKGLQTDHVVIQCFALYFFGFTVNSLGMLLMSVGTYGQGTSMLDGLTYKTTLIIMTNSCQGMLSSLFLKYADTIFKKFSSNIATLVTGALSASLYKQALSLRFFTAFAMISMALHHFYTLKPGFQVPFPDPSNRPLDIL